MVLHTPYTSHIPGFCIVTKQNSKTWRGQILSAPTARILKIFSFLTALFFKSHRPGPYRNAGF
jgi:hypothetical protein